MAYALVVSLKQTLEPLLDSSRSRIQIPNSVLKLIYDDLCYTKSFFDKINSLEDSNSIEEVEKQIKDVVQNAQDLIESHLSDLVHSGSSISTLISSFSLKLVEVNEKLGLLINKLKAKEEKLTGYKKNSVPVPSSVSVKSRFDFGRRNNEIVGLEDEVMELKQRVFRGNSRLQVISITGMAGIGKTALAEKVYFDQQIMEQFDVCLFVEIGLKYELKELLLRLLSQVVSEEMKGLTANELGEELHIYLFSRRYLVVLDGIWDIGAWSKLRQFFPDNSNDSAIILTTRTGDVARGACSEENILMKRFMDDEESWELLCKMSFSEMEACPPELEKIGKTIAKELEGLPLLIVEIGQLLSNTPTTAENWMAVARNINSSSIPGRIMHSYYAELPPHLKACFLYLGLFQPNYNIPTCQLFRLWIAEGFIDVDQPVADHQSLEQKAEEYLEDLVSRNLVLVAELSSRGRIKTCRISPPLQYLCVSEARQQKIFHVVKGDTGDSSHGTKNQRRLGFQSSVILGFKQVHNLMNSVSGARSLLCVSPQHQRPLQVYLGFRWLRVLHALSIRFWKFPHEVVKLVRLRYLAITYDGEIPASISALWNLQVFIIRPSQSRNTNSFVFLPLEIWKLHNLRHLDCMGFDLPDPCAAAASGDHVLLFLDKLLTLSGVSARTCMEGVLARMPNIIKLGIWCQPTHHAVESDDAVFIHHLHHLESFKCVVVNAGLASAGLASSLTLTVFPSALTKLTLSGCGFLWDEHMHIISQLLMLQVLKLRMSAFCGREWKLHEGGFTSLNYLLLEDLDIEQLTADYYNFPVLEQLLIRRCYNLQEIPSGIGDIPTLEVIEVDHCSMSVLSSAELIQQEQMDYGNDLLQVRIREHEI